MAKEIKITERVQVKGTGTMKLVAGKVYSVHPETAKRLIEKKAAEAVKAAKE